MTSPTEQAQQRWWEVILGSLRQQGVSFGGPECTPGYYNNEGVQAGPNAIRNAGFGGGTLAFIDILRDWRKGDDLSGLEVTRSQTSPNS